MHTTPLVLPARLLLAMLIVVLLASGGVTESPLAAAEQAEIVDNSEKEPFPDANRTTKKQLQAFAGLAALAGIVIVGVALVGLISLWAGRLRRQLRRPLPDATLPDRDFWFLKPPKPTVSSSSLPDSHQPPHEIPPTDLEED